MSRAARDVHVAQPALSRQIRDLERELGVALLERHAKGVTLTLAGEAFARGATQILADTAAALDRAEATAAGRRGRVVLGALGAFIALGFPSLVLEALRRDHPELNLVVQDLDPPDVYEDLRAGVIDLALGLDDRRDATLVAIPLWDEQADRALLPAGHRLARRRTVAVPDLGVLPLVIAQRGYSGELLEHGLAALRARGLRSPLLVLDAGLRAAHLAVAAGRGWTVITRARALVPPAGTAVVPLEGLSFSVEAQALWRRGERRPVVRTVLETVLDLARGAPTPRVPAEPRLPPVAGVRTARQRPAGTVPPTVEIRHLRALLAVAAAQTIGRAAERLGVTQPSLSRQLQDLEHAVAVPLLERSARGVQLTPAGSSLTGDCPSLLVALEHMVQETTRARRGMEGRCVIGAVATAATSELLTRLLTECAARHPHVHVALEELGTPLQPPALARGEIDLGLAHAHPGIDDRRELAHLRIVDDRLQTALLSPSHPLAQRKQLRAADLANVPFLMMERSFSPRFYDRVMAAFAAIGLTPRIDGTHNGLSAIWALAGRGRGWGLGFRSHLRRPPAGTVAVPIAGLDIAWGIDLLWRRDERSPAVRAVVDVIRALRQRRAIPRAPFLPTKPASRRARVRT